MDGSVGNPTAAEAGGEHTSLPGPAGGSSVPGTGYGMRHCGVVQIVWQSDGKKARDSAAAGLASVAQRTDQESMSDHNLGRARPGTGMDTDREVSLRGSSELIAPTKARAASETCV
jgi:hypothetical protein